MIPNRAGFVRNYLDDDALVGTGKKTLIIK
jgi:hypothetical protein